MKLLILFLILFVSCSSNKGQYCENSYDCPPFNYCEENKCYKFQYCLDNQSYCPNDKKCVFGICVKKQCNENKDCKEGICYENFCINIEKKDIGFPCHKYGNNECKSAKCIEDEYGIYCSKNCITECPKSMYCKNKECHFIDNEGDKNGSYGSNCKLNGSGDCNYGLDCIENIYNKNEDLCLNSCNLDNDCYQGASCKYYNSKKYCFPLNIKKEGDICKRYGSVECKNNDNKCINILNNNYCTKECFNDIECKDTNICKKINSKSYCVINSSKSIGETCKKFGNLECQDGLICDNGVCSKYCKEDENCPNNYICVNNYNNKKVCRTYKKAPRNKKIGESCFENLGGDCKKNLVCLSGRKENIDAYCSKSCKEDKDCNNGFFCSSINITEDKFCLKGEKGKLGASCISEACNEGLFCYQRDRRDLTSYCSKYCENENQKCNKSMICKNIYYNLFICEY